MGEVVRIDRDAPAGDLDALPRVAEQGPPTPAEFAGLIAAEQPVVLRGLVDRWPAVEAGRTPAGLIAYLKGMDRGVPAPVMEAPAKSGGSFAYGPDMREFSFMKRFCICTAPHWSCAASQLLGVSPAEPATGRGSQVR